MQKEFQTPKVCYLHNRSMRHERDDSVLHVVGEHMFGVFIGAAWFAMPFCIHIDKLGQQDILRS